MNTITVTEGVKSHSNKVLVELKSKKENIIAVSVIDNIFHGSKCQYCSPFFSLLFCLFATCILFSSSWRRVSSVPLLQFFIVRD